MRIIHVVPLVLLLAAGLLNLSATANAGQFYANGNNINLVSGRSNTYSSSPVQSGNILDPTIVSFNYKEFRVANSANGPYWQVNFPRGYEVNTAYVETYEDGFDINTIDVHTTTDGINWINQGTSPTVVHNGNGNKINFGLNRFAVGFESHRRIVGSTVLGVFPHPNLGTTEPAAQPGYRSVNGA